MSEKKKGMENMHCPTCGKEGTGRFCENCGTALVQRENQQQTPQMDSMEPPKKKVLWKRWWFWFIVVMLFGVVGSIGNPADQQTSGVVQGENASEDKQTMAVVEEEKLLTDIDTTYIIKSGHYVAGVDIPSGVCRVTALSGQGNLMSSNMYQGGVNEMFGVDDGSGFYTAAFDGLQLPKDVVLSVTGGLEVQLDYSELKGGFAGRTYDEANAFALGSGNYTGGKDFPVGIYRVTAVSGQGNLMSSNLLNGGVNEMFGVDDGSGWYLPEFVNLLIQDGTTLSVTGGLNVKMVPSSVNN